MLVYRDVHKREAGLATCYKGLVLPRGGRDHSTPKGFSGMDGTVAAVYQSSMTRLKISGTNKNTIWVGEVRVTAEI